MMYSMQPIHKTTDNGTEVFMNPKRAAYPLCRFGFSALQFASVVEIQRKAVPRRGQRPLLSFAALKMY